MPNNVDRRVVQLSLENAQFERNIAKSKKSIDELKQAMDFDQTSRGLSRFSEGINSLRFEKFEENIQKLADKFTGLGTIGELVVSQIRRHIESAASRISGFIDSMTTVQMRAGMEKYDMLNNAVQTIKAATGRSEEEVYDVMKRLNQYTDETSYNFADMAKNIGKFTSVGIKLEDAERQMEGIANWAARSGAGITEASRAMYNLSQAMGVGKLTLIDWKSIENAGMATKEFKQQLIDSAVAAGTLEKKVDKATGNATYKTAKQFGKQVEVSAENMGSTLNKGWATSNVLSSTLEKYYWDALSDYDKAEPLLKLAEDQKAAFDKMFEDDEKLSGKEWKTLESMGIATEETKQKLLDLAVTNKRLTKEIDKDGNTVYKAVTKNGKEIIFTADKIEESLSSGWFDKGLADTATSINDLAKSSFEAAQKCLKFSDVLDAWKDQISTGWMNTWKTVFGDLSVAMEFFSKVCEKVADPLGKLIDLRNNILDAWAGHGGRTSLFTALVGDDEKGIYGLLDTFESVRKIFEEGLINFVSIFTGPAQAELFRDEKNGMIWFAEEVGWYLSDLTQKFQNFVASIKDFFNEEIEVGGKTTTRLEMIQNVVNGIGGALAIGYLIVTNLTGFIRGIAEDLQPSFDSILNFFSELGLTVYDTADKTNKSGSILKFFTRLREKLKPITEGINHVIGSISDLLIKLLRLDKESGNSKSAFATIGKAILKIADIVGRVVGPILDFFGDVIDALGELFEGGFTPENIQEFGKKIGIAFDNMIGNMPDGIQRVYNFFKDVLGDLNELFEGGITVDKLKDFGSKLKEAFNKMLDGGMPQSIQNVLNFFKDAWEKIKGIFSSQSSGGEGQDTGIFGLFERVKNWILEKIQGVRDFFSSLIGESKDGEKDADKASTTFAEWLGSLDWSKILVILGSVAGISLAILMFIKIIKLVKDFSEVLGDFVDVCKNGFKLKLNTEEEKAQTFAEQVLMIAAAIGVITLCIQAIGNMPFDKALQGIIGIGLIMAGIVIFFKIMKKEFTDEDEGIESSKALAMAASIVAIALAVSIIVKALLPLAGLNLDQFLTMFGGFVIILGGLYLFMRLVSKLEDYDPKSLYGVLALAAAIMLIVLALMPLSLMPLDKLAQGIGALVVILLILWGFMKVTSKLTMEGSGMIQMVALAAAVALLALSLVPLALIPWDRLKIALQTVGIILAMLVVFMAITKGLSMQGSGMIQLAALAAAVAILALSLVPLALIPWDRLKIALVAVGAILLMLVVFMALTKKVTMQGTGMVQLIALAGAVAILALMLLPLALLPLDKLAQGVGAVVVILAALTLAVVLLSKTKSSLKDSGVVGFLAIAGAIAILMIALLPLAFLDLEEVMHMVIGVIVIVGMLSLLVFAVSKINWKDAIGGVLIMLSVMGVLLILGEVLMKIKDIPEEKLMNFMWVLVALFGGVAVLAVVAGLIGFTGVIAAIVLVGGIIAAILGVITLMGPSAAAAIAEMGASLSIFAEMMKEFSGRMNGVDEGSMDKAKRVIELLASLVLKMGAFAIGVGFSVSLTDSISQLDIFAELASGFTKKMAKVSTDEFTKADTLITTLSAMFDYLATTSLGNGSAYTMSLYLTDLMSQLYLFAEIAADFSSSMSEVDDGIASKTNTFVSEILGAIALIEGFTYTDDLGDFTTAIWDLGSTANLFMQDTSGIGDVSQNGAIQLIKELSGCASDLKTIEKLNIDTLTAQLTGLGGAMMIYAKGTEEATGIEMGEGAPDVTAAVGLLRAISDSLTEDGGFTIPENMPSEESLGIFGAQLAALAGALVMFEDAGSKLGEGTKKALETLDFFKDLKIKLTENSIGTGLKSLVLGFIGEGDNAVSDHELETFGKNIEQLGLAMAKFADSTSIIDESTGEMKPIDYTKATDALTSLSKLQENLPTIGSITSWVTGTKESLTAFSGDLVELGKGLASFAMSVMGQTEEDYKGIDVDLVNSGTEESTLVVEKAVEILGKIVEIHGKLNPEGGWLQSIWTGTRPSFTVLAGQLKSLGIGIRDFALTVTGQSSEGGYTGVDTTLNENGVTATGLTVESAVDILQKLVEARNSLNPDAGWLQSIWSGTRPSFTVLAGQLKTLGVGIRDFALTVTGRASDSGDYSGPDQSLAQDGVTDTGLTVDSAIDILNKLITVRNRLKTKTGIESIWSKTEPSFSPIAGELKRLGEGIRDFSLTVTGKDPGSDYKGFNADDATQSVTDTGLTADKAIEILNKLVEIRGTLTPQKGTNWITSIWEGTVPDFGKLGGELSSLGAGLKSFSDAVNGGEDGKKFDAEQATAAAGVVTSMIEIMGTLSEKLPKVGGLGEAISTAFSGRGANLTDVSNKIGEMGDGLSKFGTAISGKFQSTTDVENALSAISHVVELMANIGRITDEYYRFGNVNDLTGELRDFLVGLTSVPEGEETISIADHLVEVMTHISQAISSAEGLDSSNIQIFASFADALNKLASTNLEQVTKDFEIVGQNIAVGVQNGINKGSSGVIDAAVAMATSAYEAAKVVLRIQSPSKKFAELGMFAGQGLAIGITNSEGIVSNAAEGMGQEALDSASNVLALISSLMAEGLDANPTISPVLDMSQAEASMNTFRSSLNGTAIGIDARYSANQASKIHYAPGGRYDQNGTASDGSSDPMAALTEQISKMGESIKNMRIVLDSGVIAGGVTDDVDMALGRRMFYAERNN